jgi:outer membrane protein assembly factor BamA
MPLGRLVAVLLCVLAVGCAHEAAHGRAWVHAVRFRGLTGVDESTLRERIAVEETGWAPWVRKKWLDEFALEGDKERIEAWLRARGYYRARVVDAVLTPQKRGAVDVELHIEQGPVVRIAALFVAGVDAALVPLHEGDVFDHDRYLAAKQALVDALRARGHAWPTVRGTVEVDPERQAATVRIDADPGPMTCLSELTVEGTSRVAARLIARHAGLVPGERYRPERIEEMRGRIYQLGLFSSVSVELEPRGDGSALVRMVVRDAPESEFKLGFGLGLEEQRNDVHARFAWVRHALWGGLRRLRLSVEPAYVATPAVWNIYRQGPAGTAELELRQLDLPWRLSTLTWTLGYDLGIDYAFQFHGPRTQLAFGQSLWHDRIHAGIAYNFQYLDFFNTDPAILDDPRNLTMAAPVFGYKDPYRLGWFEEEISLDLRDRPLDAHRGIYSSLGVEQGGIYAGGDFTYEKVLAQLRAYVPLGEFATLAAQVQFGQLVSQGDSPITRRFYLGGPTSHRGFSYNRLSPQVVDPTNGLRIPVGGEQMVLAQFEVRAQVVQIAGQWLGVVMFADGGDVVPSGSVDLADLHWALGGGLRFKTELGTLRFDVAGRLNRLQPTESNGRENPDPGQSYAFHLSFGEAF